MALDIPTLQSALEAKIKVEMLAAFSPAASIAAQVDKFALAMAKAISKEVIDHIKGNAEVATEVPGITSGTSSANGTGTVT